MKILNKKFNFLLPIKVKNLIRLGRNFDGGYLVCADTLDNCKNLVTFGVGDDTSFERDLDKLKKLENLHLYDYTVSFKLFFYIILKYTRRFITLRAKASNIIDSINNFLNFKEFIAQPNVKLFKEKVVLKINEKNNINLDQIFSRLKNKNNSLVKMDIEGGEYEIIDKLIEYHNNIEMLIIEFHWINNNKDIFEESIKKLNDKFKIIHLHVNNYNPPVEGDYFFNVIEVSFIKKKDVKDSNEEYRYQFPIDKLDFECKKDGPAIKFSFSS